MVKLKYSSDKENLNDPQAMEVSYVDENQHEKRMYIYKYVLKAMYGTALHL